MTASDLIALGYTLWIVFIVSLVINRHVVPLVYGLFKKEP